MHRISWFKRRKRETPNGNRQKKHLHQKCTKGQESSDEKQRSAGFPPVVRGMTLHLGQLLARQVERDEYERSPMKHRGRPNCSRVALNFHSLISTIRKAA